MPNKTISSHNTTFTVDDHGVILSVECNGEVRHVHNAENKAYVILAEKVGQLQFHRNGCEDVHVAAALKDDIHLLITMYENSWSTVYRHMCIKSGATAILALKNMIVDIAIFGNGVTSARKTEDALAFLRVLISNPAEHTARLLIELTEVYNTSETCDTLINALNDMALSSDGLAAKLYLIESFVGKLVWSDELVEYVGNFKHTRQLTELPAKMVAKLVELKAVEDESWSEYTLDN